MKEKILITANLIICSAFPLLSQSVYMHEAQQEASEGDGFSFIGFIVLIILIGIIWFISRCINDYSESRRKEKLRIQDEERKKQDEEKREQIRREVENFIDSINCKNCLQIGNYKAVDLGLPSKTLWATENIGASDHTVLGDLFAWGNNTKITQKTISNTFQTPLQISDIKKDKRIKDNNGTFSGIKDYDAATNARGERWRTPTVTDIQELFNNCTWQYIASSTVKGWKVIGNNGNFIFFPIMTEFLLDERTAYLTSTSDPDDTKISECQIGTYKYGLFLMFNLIESQEAYSHELESRGRIRGGYVRAVAKSDY